MSIYKSAQGEAAILTYYDRAVARMGILFEDMTVKTRFGDTHLLVSGPKNAPPLVILQGGNVVNPVSLWWFTPLMQRYRVYAPDTVGHPGKSAQSRISPRDNSYGEWVTDVLDGLGLARAVLIGPSYGAGIILRAAAHAPERIEKAVLIVPSGIATDIWSAIRKVVWPMLRYQMAPSPEHLLPAVQPMFTERADRELTDAIGQVYQHVTLEHQMPKTATRAELARFTAPTLLIAAEKDLFFPARKVVPRATAIIPNLVAVRVLEGSNHYPSKAGIAQINEWILQFLTTR